MRGHECYHCKQWVEEGEVHDCWTTTEKALTKDLSDDLQEAWERLRESAVALGEQRIYASHHSIMFARKSCYFFVRPKRKFLEVCVFLGREVKAPQVRRADRTSKTKVAHSLRITHRDEVEAPITDWLREAYDLTGVLASPAASKDKTRTPGKTGATAKAAATAVKKRSPVGGTAGRVRKAAASRASRRPGQRSHTSRAKAKG